MVKNLWKIQGFHWIPEYCLYMALSTDGLRRIYVSVQLEVKAKIYELINITRKKRASD
jgi:hypothetical protein